MPDRSHQVEELYHAALERPAHEREAFLLQATAGDDALRHDVESRLIQDSPTVSSVESPFSLAPGQSGDSTLGDIADPLNGKLLSHYRVLQMIGAGGMGVVYRAHDERLDRDVALKVLPPSRLASGTARDRFRKEALALAKLNHPHIGAIYDFDQEQGIDFLVMEYVPGKSLAHRLASGPLSEAEILNLAMQIARALAEAHSKGIVHRDLKPGNIVVTPDQQAKVLDFGVAKLLHPGVAVPPVEELIGIEAAAGTLPYMAPEQLQGIPADARTDIYGAGAVLYEMATRQRPFRAKSATELAADIQTHLPEPPRLLNPKISPRLEQIILKCLEKKPESRYQSASDLLADLKHLETAETESARTPVRTRRRLPLLAISSIVLLLVASYPLWKQSFLHKTPPGKITLAVLPFENLSGDTQEEYFCDGLTDEMINRLGRLTPQRLGVIARTSAMRYKNTHKPVDEIGRELGVNYLLETGVRREGSRVRISTQLVQVRDQTTLWTETYEYDVAGVFALERDVSDRIARSLALQLLPSQQPAQPHTTNAEAHDAYLHGRYHWNRGSAEERRKAREYFEQSIQADPNFAPAYAEVAAYYAAADDLSARIAIPKAKEYAVKALQLDDSLTQAHTALAGIRFYGDWDWPGAESEFKRGLALNPNDAETRRIYSNYLLALGRFDEAQLEIQHAQELDPVSLLTSVNYGWTFYFARQYDRAIEQCRKALELDADSDSAHACLSQSYRAKGIRGESIGEAERAVTLSGRRPARLVTLARAYAAFGKEADARKVLLELREQAKRGYVSPYLLAMVHAALGDNNEALVALDQAYAEHDPYLVWLKVDDAFDSLRANPRFRDLLRRVGFPS